MGFVATNKGGEFELAPEGTHVARAYRLIDMGTQYSAFYKKSARKFRLYFELPSEHMKDGRPFSVSKRYTLSFHEKSDLRKDLQAWRGRKFEGEEAASFDVTQVIGKPCMVTVGHSDQNGTVYANIMAIAALPKGMEVPPQVNPTFIFTLDDFDQTKFESLPDGLKGKIMESEEYKRMKNIPVKASSDLDDDIPW